MNAHYKNWSNGEALRGIFDGEAIKQFDSQFLDFVVKPRNLQFMLATQPFLNCSTLKSVLPMILINYNLPLELAIKSAILISALNIPVKKQVNILDIYLGPLLDEFTTSWSQAIMVHDISRLHEGDFNCTLCWSSCYIFIVAFL